MTWDKVQPTVTLETQVDAPLGSKAVKGDLIKNVPQYYVTKG